MDAFKRTFALKAAAEALSHCRPSTFALFTFVRRLLLFCVGVFVCMIASLFFCGESIFVLVFLNTPRFALFHFAYLLLLYLNFHFTFALNAASSGANVFDLFCGNLAAQKRSGAQRQSEIADSHKSVSSYSSLNPLAIWMNFASSVCCFFFLFWLLVLLPSVFVYLKKALTWFFISALLHATVTPSERHEKAVAQFCCNFVFVMFAVEWRHYLGKIAGIYESFVALVLLRY